MKVKCISLCVALALIIMAGSAYAGVPSLNPFNRTDVGALEVGGDILLFSYYDIRTMAQGGPGLSDNYFTVTNIRDSETFPLRPYGDVTTGWIQAHLRVRTGQCSVELLDFDVILSPNDVFTFDLYQAEDGETVFASCDENTLVYSGFNVDANGCFILDTGTFPNMLSLIDACGNCPDGSDISLATALEETRFGYVEIIGEIEMLPVSGADPDEICSEGMLEAGMYTGWEWVDGDGCGFKDVDPILFGRQYYAAFDGSRNLVRLATSNAFAGDAVCGGDRGARGFARPGIPPDNVPGPCSGSIVHRPCYSDNSPGCDPGDGELENLNMYVNDQARFAYDQARTSIGSSQGARDMNYCFWNYEIGTDLVENRVGAGATQGPTLADGRVGVCAPFRNGSALNTECIISEIDGFFEKPAAVSHFFAIPDQGQTRFAFTLPRMHFVNQQIAIDEVARFDTAEEPCTVPSGKFISPGLPGQVLPRGEVTLIGAEASQCSANEGWIAYTFEITGDGPSSEILRYTTGSFPFVLGVVVNWGDGSTADVIATSPIQWTDLYYPN
jgi:hypothetical protein